MCALKSHQHIHSQHTADKKRWMARQNPKYIAANAFPETEYFVFQPDFPSNRIDSGQMLDWTIWKAIICYGCNGFVIRQKGLILRYYYVCVLLEALYAA